MAILPGALLSLGMAVAEPRSPGKASFATGKRTLHGTQGLRKVPKVEMHEFSWPGRPKLAGRPLDPRFRSCEVLPYARAPSPGRRWGLVRGPARRVGAVPSGAPNGRVRRVGRGVHESRTVAPLHSTVSGMTPKRKRSIPLDVIPARTAGPKGHPIPQAEWGPHPGSCSALYREPRAIPDRRCAPLRGNASETCPG